MALGLAQAITLSLQTSLAPHDNRIDQPTRIPIAEEHYQQKQSPSSYKPESCSSFHS
jgi:hypothetical protein